MRSGFFNGGIGPTAIKRRSGLAAPVPVAGAEIIINGGMELDANWPNDATPTTNERSSAQARSGTYSRRVVGDANGDGIYQIRPFPLGWLRYSGYLYLVSGAVALTTLDNDGSAVILSEAPSLTAGAWVGFERTIRATKAGSSANTRIRCLGGAGEFYVDDISVVPLTLSSLFSSRAYASADCDLSVAITRTAGTQAGLCARLDSATTPANFIIAYLDGAGNVKVDKCVAGTYTNVISGAVTYVAGATLRLVCSGNNVTAYYNGAMVGTAQVTDAGVISNTLHGLFSTYATNTFANYRNRVDEWVTSEAAPVPVAGAGIINGDFSAWTGDNPTGWTITGESGSDPMVTQVVGGARFYTSAGFLSAKQANLFQAGDWIFESISATRVSGEIAIRDETHTNNYLVLSASGSYLQVRRNASPYTGIALTRNATPTDWTVASIASYKLILASLFSSRAYAAADCDLSVAITRTSGTQAGLVARLDNATSPANFLIAYENGAGRVRVDKCVAGTYTNIIDGAVTYAAGRVLRLVCGGNSVSVYYNGVQVGTTQTVSDAGIVSNTRHGLFSTYAANTFTGYTAL